MITVGVIRNGGTYLSEHLRRNDYWAEGEKHVEGQWIGRAATMLGLKGNVADQAFESLRENRDWRTGARLTARQNKQRMALFDIQISAPKDVSVLAMVGRDHRVREAFVESVRTILSEMEQFAAVRERRGTARNSESYRLTGNFAGAMFVHDASRDLDPQLHVHVVLANVTWDSERSRWMALQHAEMMRASPYLRQAFYRELAGHLRALGYEPYEMTTTGFSVRGVEHLRERFSKRTREVQMLVLRREQELGRKVSKREVEVIVRESRPRKLLEVTTDEVRKRQRTELRPAECQALESLVRGANERQQSEVQRISQSEAGAVLDAALRHVMERKSVAREGEVLGAVLELHPDFTAWRLLQPALANHPDVVRCDGELTLRSIRDEEAAALRQVRHGRNTRLRLGDPALLPRSLTAGQTRAARQLLQSKDFLTVLVGDAGTGKTTLLVAIQEAHRSVGGTSFLALAPTTRARDGLAESGFASADTVQRFLVSPALQAQAAGRVVLVDESGLLSTRQLHRLTTIAHERHARLLMVGDTKQHYSVERGDALRSVVEHAHAPVVRLAEVLRQRDEPDRHLSRLLAAGEMPDALLYAERRGLIHDAGGDEALFTDAAERYARNLAEGRETLVVIPLWDEIDRFTHHARQALRRVGLLGELEVDRQAVRPLQWTREQKVHWRQYRPGDRLLFQRDMRDFRRGTSVEVVGTASDGLLVRGGGRQATIGRKQAGAFEVGRAEVLPLAVGDRVLFRGSHIGQGLANGDVKQVARIEPDTGNVIFSDGKSLPPDFHAWTYGHAMTAYRSQGTTAEESFLVLGEAGARSLSRRQFYVANTRYRARHRIFVANRDLVLSRLCERDAGRELAGEFVARRRHRLTQMELVSRHRLTRALETVRVVMRTAAAEWQRLKETIRHRIDV